MTNRLVPEPLAAASCPAVAPADAPDYLRDESRLVAEGVRAVYRPADAAEVAGAFARARARGERAVLSGGRTGIAGGAVPLGADAVVSLGGLAGFVALGRDADGPYLRVRPGVTLGAVADALAHPGSGAWPLADEAPPAGALAPATDAERAFARAYRAGEVPPCWFPVDPTEANAHVGGAVSANASGARTFRYGPMRCWVRALWVVLADGRLLRLRRGAVRAEGGRFRLAAADPTAPDADIALPAVDAPACKHSLGYATGAGLDAVDLFVGQEGTLGAIVEVELALAYAPAGMAGVVCVVPDEEAALGLCARARGYYGAGVGAGGSRPPARGGVALTSIEYFSPEALAMLRARRDAAPGEAPVPALPKDAGAAVYLEFAVERDGAGGSPSPEEADARLMAAMEPLAEWLAEVGGDLDGTWAGLTPDEIARQKRFRHAVPETVNAEIGRRALSVPGLHKVGTDMAVPDAALRPMMAAYREGLAASGLEAVLFGHLGDNHLHVNILPRTLDELARAKALYRGWAARAVELGGAVAAEHGIGRLKRDLFAAQYPAEAFAAWRAMRSAFDPERRLAPGVLVD